MSGLYWIEECSRRLSSLFCHCFHKETLLGLPFKLNFGEVWLCDCSWDEGMLGTNIGGLI